MDTDRLAFESPAEQQLSDEFLSRGYIVRPAEDRGALDAMRDMIAQATADHLSAGPVSDVDDFLNTTHERVPVEDLNSLRLAVLDKMAACPWFRAAYFGVARQLLEDIVGNELVMQRRVSISVQLPQDDSSLLPVHADVWSGDSPYEIVLWIPWVDVYKTKSMYILPKEKDDVYAQELARFSDGSSEDIFEHISDDVDWLDIPYGNVLAFTQNLMHGNVVNREKDTRWSSNCRFKSLFSPYADKKLGEFFEPIKIRPATVLGGSYQLPDLVSE